MNYESPIYNFVASGLTLIATFCLLFFLKTERKHFLIQEVSNRDKIAQLVINEKGKFQIVDIDSILVSEKEWDDVVVYREDLFARDGKPLSLHGLILRHQKIFLKSDNQWCLADISLKSIKPIENCDSIESFFKINNDDYARCWYGDLVGLIKCASGEKVIATIYKELSQDSDMNFIVKDKDGRAGVIDLQGNLLVNTEYESVSQFSGNIYLALRSNEKSLHSNGTIRYSCSDCSIGSIGSSYAVRRLDGFQLLNSSLSFQSPLLEDYNYLSTDYFSFKIAGMMGVYQMKASNVSEIIPPRYISIQKEADGYWSTNSTNNKVGMYYMDQEIIPARFDDVDLEGNYVFVKLNSRWGLWDSHVQKEWISPSYKSIQILSGDMVKVNDGNGIGLLKKSSNFSPFIRCQYSDILDKGSYYELQKNGRVGVADYSGNEILPPTFSQVEKNSNSDLGAYYVASRNGWRYLLDSRGYTIIPENYSFVEIQGAGLALIKNSYGDFGWYNIEDRQLQIACKYKKVDNGFSYQADIVRVYDGSSWFNIDYYGNKREGSSAINKAENLLDEGVDWLEKGIDAAKDFFK